MTEEPKMPEILIDLATMINRMPANDVFRRHWKRLRIAVTQAEMDEIRKFYFADAGEFVSAIRGVSIHVEEFPLDPSFICERAV